jgi:hypothetical protein
MNGRERKTPKSDSDKGSRAEFKQKINDKIEARKTQEKKTEHEKKQAHKKRTKNLPKLYKKKPSSKMVSNLRTAKEKGHLWVTK